MSRNTKLLELIARTHPYLWEILHPHVPILYGFGYVDRFAAVELNPQPIPPGIAAAVLSEGAGAGKQAAELNPQPLPPRAEVLVAAAGLAQQLAQFALFAQAQNGNGAELLVREIDDWCGTRPRPIPWPKNWPLPWPPIPEPDPEPHPWLTAEVFTVAALTLASVGARLGAGQLRDGFDKSVDQLLDAALAV
ncbi:MAG: hypothetical protein QOE89_1934 [Pseudonocardiales bacterium]|nr:hypothetical protein [Pseudonocardiales bacterium]